MSAAAPAPAPALRYPEPIVELSEGRERFLRGRSS